MVYEEIAEDGVTPVYGLQVSGDIHIGGSNLYLGTDNLSATVPGME